MASDPYPRNIHAGMKKSAETTKRKLVADIARFGSEAFDRTQRQRDTEDALTAASEPLNEAADMNQGILADLSGQRDLVLGNYDEDATAAEGRHQRSNDRRAAAHTEYLDKLKGAVPYHRRELKAYGEALAEGRAAGRGGGGGGGRGGSPRQTKVVTKEIPQTLELQGFQPQYIERLGGMVGEAPDLFKAIDEQYATLVESGMSSLEVNSEIRRLLREAGLGNVQITDYLNMFNAKYADSFEDPMGPLLDLGGFGMQQHGPGGNSTNQRTPSNAISDYMGQFPQSSTPAPQTPSRGEVYLDDGTVFWEGKIYTLQEWQAAQAMMERAGSFGLF